MTKEEAKKWAEAFVYCDCNLGDILFHCRMAGISTHSPKGKQKPRSVHEEKLIEHYTKELSTNQKEKQNAQTND